MDIYFKSTVSRKVPYLENYSRNTCEIYSNLRLFIIVYITLAQNESKLLYLKLCKNGHLSINMKWDGLVCL